jgi:hypothetical protein
MRKVLIIESSDGLRRELVRELRARGYEVTDAETLDDLGGPKQLNDSYSFALLDDRAVVEELSSHGVAVALFDFLSGRSEELRDLFDYVRANKLVGIVEKQGVVLGETLLQCVDHYMRYGQFPNGLATFEWHGSFETGAEVTYETDGLWTTASNRLATAMGGETACGEEEVAVLFRALISPCATRVELKPHGRQGHGGAVLLEARVHFGDGAFPEHLAIKCGNKDTVLGEMFNYDRHVGPLPDGVAAQLRWRAQTKNLAAIAYSWVDDSVESAEEFSPRFDDEGRAGAVAWRRRRGVINRLFHVSLNSWYEAFRDTSPALDRQPEYLVEYYAGVDGVWGHKKDLRDMTFDLPGCEPTAVDWDFGFAGVHRNPLLWILESTLAFTRVAPCHGDLHVRNIFLLPDDSPRLIDFGRTSLGHVFRDFAALEVSVRLKCHRVSHPLLLALAEKAVWEGVTNLGSHLEHRLEKVASGSVSTLSAGERSGVQDLEETIRTTMDIRRAALAAVGRMDWRRAFWEYVVAVTMHQLKYGGGEADDTSGGGAAVDSSTAAASGGAVGDRGWVWQALYGAALAAEAGSAVDFGS